MDEGVEHLTIDEQGGWWMKCRRYWEDAEGMKCGMVDEVDEQDRWWMKCRTFDYWDR